MDVTYRDYYQSWKLRGDNSEVYRLGGNFKNYNKSVQPLYDIEDIYEWIDYMRETGLEQSLK